METNVKDSKRKKGLLAVIWESMTKTGGCCGSGESCGCSPQSNTNQEKTKGNRGDAKAGEHNAS